MPTTPRSTNNNTAPFLFAGFLRASPGNGTAEGTCRLIGAVEAGFPSPAEEELVDTLSLDE